MALRVVTPVVAQALMLAVILAPGLNGSDLSDLLQGGWPHLVAASILSALQAAIWSASRESPIPMARAVLLGLLPVLAVTLGVLLFIPAWMILLPYLAMGALLACFLLPVLELARQQV